MTKIIKPKEEEQNENLVKITNTNDKFSFGINIEKRTVQWIDFSEENPRTSEFYKMNFETFEEFYSSKTYQKMLGFFGLDKLSEKNDDRRYYENTLHQAFLDTLSYYRDFPETKRINEILLVNLKANDINKNSIIDAQIVGEAELQAIPKSVIVACRDCNEMFTWELETKVKNIFNLEEQEKEKYLNLLQVLINSSRGKVVEILRRKAEDYLLFSCNENTNGKHKPIVEITGNVELQTIFIKDIISNDVREFKSEVGKVIKTYLIGRKSDGISKAKLHGTFVVDVKNNQIRPIIFHAESLTDDVQGFVLTTQDKEDFKVFNKLTDDIIDETIAPSVIGRTFEKIAVFLTLHSVLGYIYRNKKCNGLIRALFFGDTKTCKSTILEDVIEKINLGELIEGESSSRTGIAYTIDNDNKTVIWGTLVYNDLTFVVIDGFQQLSGNETAQLREVFEKARIKVRRYASGEALARVRIVACANPKKEMDSYLYKCEGIKPRINDFDEGFKPFSSPPDVTRWHIFIPFSDKDVPPERFLTDELLKREEEKDKGFIRDKINPSVLRRHILWSWSRTSEQIRFTDEALKEMMKESVRIQKDYSYSELPIVHNGFHEVVTRISVASACLYHSTDETHENVIVDLPHVEYAIEFLEKMFAKLQLNDYIGATKHISTILDKEEKVIIDLINISPNRQILEALAIKGTCSSAVLGKICNTSDKTIKRRLPALQAMDLVKSKKGVGSSITDKGIQVIKKFIKPEPEENNSSSFSLPADLKIVFDKIKDLSNEDCLLVHLQNALPNITGMQSKLVILDKQKEIEEDRNGNWRVLK